MSVCTEPYTVFRARLRTVALLPFLGLVVLFGGILLFGQIDPRDFSDMALGLAFLAMLAISGGLTVTALVMGVKAYLKLNRDRVAYRAGTASCSCIHCK